jgi:hypothetical protein
MVNQRSRKLIKTNIPGPQNVINEDFKYNSEINPRWLTMEELRAMVSAS